MKILVFVKQVPDTDDVKLDPKTGNIMREGVASKMNPLDANAVEAAVQLKEKYGATVCAVCMGPPQAEDVLKKSLALGCDEAYLLSDRAFGGADTLATAYTRAMAAKPSPRAMTSPRMPPSRTTGFEPLPITSAGTPAAFASRMA